MTTVVDRAARVAAVVVLAAALAGVVTVAVVTRPQRSGLDRTRLALLDDRRFANGPKAGSTFADASEWLLDDAKSCQAHRGATDPRCRLRLSAAAYSGVAAFVAVDCTAPGVYRARKGMLSYLRAIAEFDRHRLSTMAPPSPPEVPKC